MVVEDVMYDNITDGNNIDHIPSENKMFRRLVFERSSGLVQSEALLISDPNSHSVEAFRRQTSLSSKSKKKGGSKRSGSSISSDGIIMLFSLYRLTFNFFWVHSNILSIKVNIFILHLGSMMKLCSYCAFSGKFFIGCNISCLELPFGNLTESQDTFSFVLLLLILLAFTILLVLPYEFWIGIERS